jgi:polysaccharide export outer membrane protein
MNLKTSAGLITLCAGLALNAFSEQAPAPKSPANNPVSAEYRLGSEDVIECFVNNEPQYTATVPIRPDGMITCPMVGDILAAGKTALELQAELTSKLREFLKDPVVNVIVIQINSPKISVLGEVHKPDIFPIRQRMTVLEAIALAGGFTEFAKRDRIVVIRNGSAGPQRIKLNLERLIKDGPSFYLQASDTVFVE